MTEESGTKVCPYCAETIKAAAIVCKHCGRDLLSSSRGLGQNSEALAALGFSGDAMLDAEAKSLGVGHSDGRYTWRGNHFKDMAAAVAFAKANPTVAFKPIFAGAAGAHDGHHQEKPFKWWLWGPLGLIVLIFAWGAATGPKTYADLAVMEEKSCLRSKGDGRWRASSGVTLEKFCKVVGNAEAREALCKAHPESC